MCSASARRTKNVPRGFSSAIKSLSALASVVIFSKNQLARNIYRIKFNEKLNIKELTLQSPNYPLLLRIELESNLFALWSNAGNKIRHEFSESNLHILYHRKF